jgi:hypothetical protein
MNVFFKPKCLTRFFKFDEYEIYCAGEEYESKGLITMKHTSPDKTDEEIYKRLTGESLLLDDGFLSYKENVPMYVRISEENIEKILKNEEYLIRNTYDPLEEAPNLYTEIAKIKFFDIPSLRRFIENFGLPWGTDLFATDIYFVMHYEMDLFPFYKLLHIYKKTLDIFEAINSHNQEKIQKYAEEFKEYVERETKEYLYSVSSKIIDLGIDNFFEEMKKQNLEIEEITEKLDIFLENKIEGIKTNPAIFKKWRNISNESPRTIAKHYLVELLNNSNKGSSTFAIINNDEIHPATTFDNLFEVAYYQLSRAVIGNVEMRHCDNCGALFEVTHDSRRFCPPLPGHKISTCQNTYNQRVKRKRKKARELAAKGYTETQIAEKLKMRTEEIREWLHSR